MKTWIVALLAVLALAVSGCKDKPKELPRAVLAEAAQNVSEAEFAMQIRDYARAEGLLAKAVELNPEEPRYWLQLGAARKRMSNTSGAKKAYEKARDVLKAEYRRDNKSPGPLFAEMEVCMLLGKPNDAKAVYDRMLKDHGDDPDVKNFVENHMLEKLLTDPNLKALSL